jgi:hypothetical protein
MSDLQFVVGGRLLTSSLAVGCAGEYSEVHGFQNSRPPSGDPVIGIELKELEECCNAESSQTTGGAVPVTRSVPPLPHPTLRDTLTLLGAPFQIIRRNLFVHLHEWR